jgi:predicted Zn-dependent protease
MKKAVLFATLLAALASLVILNSCATNPVTGERQFVLMTESQEIEMGREADEEIIAEYGLYPDDELQAYVDGVGQRMAALSHRPHLQWHFRVLDTPVVNAFAVPGGYIYITRGLLAYINSEAELSMVIGHEIGHVAARHTVTQYSKQVLIMGGILIGMAASEKFRKYAPLAIIGVQLLFLKFSRDQERQADDLGVLYGYRAGYDPGEFDNFFGTLNRMSEESGGGGLPGFLSTHPNTPNRIHDVQDECQRVMAATPPSGQLAVNRDGYLQKIDGLVFGEDPRQGYTEGNAFYHPGMRFQFAYPSGWELSNLASAVQIKPSSGDAFISLSIDSKAGIPKQAFDNMVSENSLTVLDTNTDSVNGLPAYHGVCSYTDSDGNSLRLRMSSIQKDNRIYNFLGACSPTDYNRYGSAFESTIWSFKNLTDSDKLSRQPKRISVKRTARSETAEKFLLDNGIDSKFLDTALLMNAKTRNDQIGGNMLMKLVR